jgi:hypothetical protein
MSVRFIAFGSAAALLAALVFTPAPASADSSGKHDQGYEVPDSYEEDSDVHVRAPYASVDDTEDGTSVEAPFTSVETGRDGTRVRAPFVDLFVPRD